MLDALTLDQLRIFVAVAEAGSFRAGAKRLSRVQSAVSHAIGNLEAELGVTLFDRSSHRPTLTSDGRALLADGRAILLKVDLMRARARGLGEGVELRLSVVVDTWFPIATVGEALYRTPTHQSAYACRPRRWGDHSKRCARGAARLELLLAKISATRALSWRRCQPCR
jgi:Bacterial regulatory helix-turn-helix protein, lysR family